MRARTHKFKIFVLVFTFLFILGSTPVQAQEVPCGFGFDIGSGLCRGYLTTIGVGFWEIPRDWNSSSNTIELIGGGGGAAGGGGSGNLGGDYSSKNNLALISGATVEYSVGIGGMAITGGGGGSRGADTWFNGSAFNNASAGARGGGSANISFGDTVFLGGYGATYCSDCNSGGGGGGAAGPNGAGNNAARPSSEFGPGASADMGLGGAGGLTDGANGSNGTEWDLLHGAGGGGSGSNISNGGNGGLYGGGAGGGVYGGETSSGGSGGQGIIVITYTPLAIDTVAPVIASHADVAAEATSTLGAYVSYDSPTATDNVDSSVMVSCTPVSGSLFAVGTTTVSCGAADVAGNRAATTTFAVFVSAPTPPQEPASPVVSPTTGSSGSGWLPFNSGPINPFPGAVAPVPGGAAIGNGLVLGASTVRADIASSTQVGLTTEQESLIVSALLRAFGEDEQTVAAVQAVLK